MTHRPTNHSNELYSGLLLARGMWSSAPLPLGLSKPAERQGPHRSATKQEADLCDLSYRLSYFRHPVVNCFATDDYWHYRAIWCSYVVLPMPG